MTDDDAQVIFLCGLAFLLGFKIAAYMGKRHLKRMKSIWKPEGK